MKAPSSLSCHWKRELGNKVLIWGWASFQKHGGFQASVCFLSRKVPDILLQWLFCNMHCQLWYLYIKILFTTIIICIDIHTNSLYVFFVVFLNCLTVSFVVSGMLELWKQDWLKEHGETPTPPSLWAPAVFVMYHWDLRLPLETLSTFPWWHYQGERGVETPFVVVLNQSEVLLLKNTWFCLILRTFKEV